MATKRKAPSRGSSGSKRRRIEVPEYCDAVPARTPHGESIWPAPAEAVEAARAFLRDCARAHEKTLIVPDKDADGLSSGVIVQRTLTALGLDSNLIDVHLLSKGNTVHDEAERQAMQAKNPKNIVVLDHGGRRGPPIIDSEGTKSLVIDHHLSDEFPKEATVVTACHCPPVATSSLLTYEICKPLHTTISSQCAWLCAIGTHGDLGTSLKWKPPFPDMSETFKTHSKKAIDDAVSLLNAPRRTAEFDVISAWRALVGASAPQDILQNERLLAARTEINAEVERHAHAPPKFSQDGRVAVLRIHSAAQVHPVIATRWAGFLQARALEIVLVANAGYLPGRVNFSCRVARSARAREPPVNIIDSLKAAAALSETDLLGRLGADFARGHREASGGIVPVEAFEELMALWKVGEKPDRPPGKSPAKKGAKGPGQKNTLKNYFAAK